MTDLQRAGVLALAAAAAVVVACSVPKSELAKVAEVHGRTVTEWREETARLVERRDNIRGRLKASEASARAANIQQLDERISLINKNLDTASARLEGIRTRVDALAAELQGLVGGRSISRADLQAVEARAKAAAEQCSKDGADAKKALDSADEKMGGMEKAIINISRGLDEGGMDHDAE